MIDSILLVPADGDPHGLLADGVCGAKVPIMHRVWGPRRDPIPRWLDGAKSSPILANAEALVLAYRGKPVPEGCDRAWRALHSMCLARAKTTGGVTYCIHMRETYTTEWVEDVCAKWEREGARLVLLDADGHEVTRA